MIERVFNPGYKLCFSRWNRKGYAIFASLGREMRIGTLAIRVCEMSLRKSSRKGVIVELAEAFGRLVETWTEKMERTCRASFPVRGDAADAVFVGIYKGKGTAVC